LQSAVLEGQLIDTNQILLGGVEEKPFPVGCSFRISIGRAAYDTVWEHARSTLAEGDAIKEVGGILIGAIYRDAAGPYLEITAAIMAEHTRNEGTEVTFTPETWVQINHVKDSLYPRERIVGWYHTHPRFGIFLSERDQFVHQHSFSQPWATAFVIDPVQNLEGFFAWSQGHPREVDEYWVGHERRLQTSRVPVHGPAEAKRRELRDQPLSLAWILPLIVSGVVALGATGMIYWRGMRSAEQLALVGRTLESQQLQLDRVSQTLRLLRQEMENLHQKSGDSPTKSHLGHGESVSPFPW
jgi:proteasome lid subunit RPN8/RPN11